MRIAVSADHRGAKLQSVICEAVERVGHELVEVLTCQGGTCDYPDLAWAACQLLAAGQVDRAILACGSGIGMCIAANKIPGVRAANCHDDITAEISRRHNDANVLCLSGDLLGDRLVSRIVEIWLNTPFDGGRHARRNEKLRDIEAGRNPAETDVPA